MSVAMWYQSMLAQLINPHTCARCVCVCMCLCVSLVKFLFGHGFHDGELGEYCRYSEVGKSGGIALIVKVLASMIRIHVCRN